MHSAPSSLQAIGQLPDTEIDIGAAAIQLARAHDPKADWEAATQHLSELARKIVQRRSFVPDTPVARAAAIHDLLVGEYGYLGDLDTYDDLANANLIRVIERRKGMPVALGILWLHCAQAAGWPAHGVNFPNHFMITIGGRGRYVVADVFTGGTILRASSLRAMLKLQTRDDKAELNADHLRPVSTRAVLLRLQNNIKLRHLHHSNSAEALACLGLMLAIAPREATLWHEAALLNQHQGRIAEAVQCCENFIDLVPSGDVADRVRVFMTELRTHMNN